MKFLRDRELHVQLLLLLPLTMAAAGVGFSRSHQAGCLALGLCALFALVLPGSAWRRYRTMEALCQDLDRILHGESGVDLDAYDEGAWSILHSQLTKLLTRLREQADRLQGDKDQMAAFLADVSHQIRTPLTALNLLGSQLADPSLSPDKRRTTSRELRQQLDRLDWLVNALLRMSRLDAGTVELCREKLSLKDLTYRAASPLAIPMELQGQSFQVVGEAQAVCDPAWTAEALGNVLKNCMEHTPASGSITVTLWENPIYSQILVEDTGPGICQEDLLHLFERFYRGQNAAPQSAGIGLALARMIITAQNGTIQASNRREGGARFTIRFYKQSAPPAP